MAIRTAAVVLALTFPALATRDPTKPTWWEKYQYLSTHAADASPPGTGSLSAGPNVDVSNECGPQSETFIAIDPTRPKRLAAGSNEIFRHPVRGYFSTDRGPSWGGGGPPPQPRRPARARRRLPPPGRGQAATQTTSR